MTLGQNPKKEGQETRGRPTKFTEALAPVAEHLAAVGWTPESIAKAFAVSRSTVYRWIDNVQEFSDAIARGREAATDLVEAAHFKAAIGFYAPETKVFIHEGCTITEDIMRFYPPDVRAQMNWLRNHRPELWARGEFPAPLPPTAEQRATKAETFEQFCANAAYPPPFPKQCAMREFVFDDKSDTSRLLLGSRGYGKTDYTTILGSAFKIYKSRQYRILIITKSDEKNAALVTEIIKALRANGVDLEKENAYYLRTAGLHGKDHSVSALTVGSSSMRGRHPDLIIMDDPVTEEDVSEATRAKLQRKYNELVKLCPNIAIIGQPVHVFDLYETLRPIVKVMEVPHGTIPELDHDLVAMKLAGVSETSINASYHLKVSSETGNPLSGVSWLDKFPAGESVAFIDPSFRGGDYTAMTVGRGHFDGIAIQGFAWKKAWADCLPDIIEACKAHSIKRLCFETNALGMQPLAVLRAAFNDASIQVGVTGRDSTGYKHSRIMAAGTFAKLIHLAKTSHRIYIDQVTKYEYGSKFDDAPDSLASLLEWIGLIRGKK